MTRPLLFLDIDGVLNSLATDFSPDGAPLDAVNIEPFNRIVSEVNPQIVITSTWRMYWSLEDIRGFFDEAGILGEIIAATPVLFHQEADGRPAETEFTRGEEIFSWFRAQEGVDPLYPPAPFVVLDDRTDLDPYFHRLVQTRMSCGLTSEDADRVIALLRESLNGTGPY